jgi:3-oxoacyl-[acyl-carrier protein] reductase
VVLAELNEFDSVEALARQARAAFGGIDILVNCAGAASTFDAWMDTPVQRWQQQFQLTTLYAVHLILSLVPDMRNAKWGRVINIGSDAAMRPRGFGPEYSAAKAALATIAVSLSDAVAADGITVNTVSSGVVLTRNTENVVLAHAQRLDPTSTVETVDQVAVRLWPSPSGKLGTPEDVASAVCYLASPRANHITGATLRVDGGMYGVVH